MRQCTLILSLYFVMLVTSSCGFHPHGPEVVSKEIKALTLDSPDLYGLFTRAVYEQLHLNNITIIKDTKCNNVPSLRILTTSENQDTVSIFQNGKTAEYQKVLTIQAELLLPGQALYPLSVSVFRSFFDNPLTALAKDSEQEIIRQEMRNQAAQQLVRKLLTVHVAPEVTNQTSSGVSKNLLVTPHNDSPAPCTT